MEETKKQEIESTVKAVFMKIEEASEKDSKSAIMQEFELEKIDRTKVPEIKFKISQKEIQKLEKKGILQNINGRYIISSKIANGSKKCTTLEKLLYAIIWKQMDLGKEARIIDGIMGKELPNRTYTFHQFGKFLNDDTGKEPLIDRNVLKCFEIYRNTRNPNDYINWVKNIVEKGVFSTTDIDDILLQLGRNL